MQIPIDVVLACVAALSGAGALRAGTNQDRILRAELVLDMRVTLVSDRSIGQ